MFWSWSLYLNMCVEAYMVLLNGLFRWKLQGNSCMQSSWSHGRLGTCIWIAPCGLSICV